MKGAGVREERGYSEAPENQTLSTGGESERGENEIEGQEMRAGARVERVISYSRWDNLEVSSDEDEKRNTHDAAGGEVVAQDSTSTARAGALGIVNGSRVQIQNLGRQVEYNGQVITCNNYIVCQNI
jgi:hypothetical protein